MIVAQFFEWKIDPDNMQIQFGMDKTLCLASFPMDNKELGAAKCEDKRFNSYLKTDPNGQDQGIYQVHTIRYHSCNDGGGPIVYLA